MLGICIAAAGKTAVLTATAFTLSWAHSVERTEWQEDWLLADDGRLQIAEARVQGSGAGMEPPDGAVLKNGWWRYAPNLPPQRELVLAASGATQAGWKLCAGAKCMELGERPGESVRIASCSETGEAQKARRVRALSRPL